MTDSHDARRVLAAGFIALDAISVEDRYTHRAGGTAANVAANLAYFGWSAHLAGLVGTDAAGRALHDDLVSAGVGVECLHQRNDVATPVVLHQVLAGGKHRFRFRCPTCGRRFPKARPLPRSETANVPLANVFFFDRPSAAAVAIAEAHREAGRLVVFEPSSKGVAHLFRAALAAAHVVKASDQRLKASEVGQTAGFRIITHGLRGLTISHGDESRQLPALPIRDVVDTGGAGDWTTAAFLARLPSLCPDDLSLETTADALRSAQAVAAISCLFAGARGLADALPANRLRELVDRLDFAAAEPAESARSARPSGESCQVCAGAASHP